jgi:hypothetical protein
VIRFQNMISQEQGDIPMLGLLTRVVLTTISLNHVSILYQLHDEQDPSYFAVQSFFDVVD